MSITIVDYGMGNLRSVQKAIERVGHVARISNDPETVRSATKLVLPGVGAFEDAMGELRRRELVAPILEFLQKDRPFLGICLGLQLLFERSFEGGNHQGLGVVPGDVVRFSLPHDYKVPHMGWNGIEKASSPPHLQDIESGSHVYFVHSYHVVPKDDSVIATRTDYGARFVSSIWRGNLFATQFHPEKSQSVGLRILRRFAER